ncbi:hypothetical protein F5Y13DRAFT_156753 [Hypoxylon sp. FL1857]|nr:hypothetical protein F5Y13DRAFT_156753 [Hypoxylon sp. FL1857]
MRRLDERKSPLSTTVWFGKYKGHELRVLYTRPERWRWLLRNCRHWAPALRNIEERYRAYRRKHPRRVPASRAPAMIVNPTGERLGPHDDRPASDNDESYDSDDGFVVRSDEEIEESEASDLDDLFSDEEDEEEETVHVPSDQDGVGADSDDSLPSLSEIVKSSPTKKTPDKSKHGSTPYFMKRSRLHAISPTSEPSPSRRHALSSSGDDEPIISPFKKARTSRRILDSDSEEGESSQTIADCIVVGAMSPGPSRTKNAHSNVIVISSDSDTDNQACEPRSQKSRPSAADLEPIDSDDEPLVPKLRIQMKAKGKL